MKTFTLLRYSATALISVLNISSVVAIPGVTSPAYGADLPQEAEYVYDFEQPRKDDGSKVIVPSYSWTYDDGKYDFHAAESHGPHARRAEPPKVPELKYYVLAPAEVQPPAPAQAFILSPITQDTTRVYYRPFLLKTKEDGKPTYVLATAADVRANPKTVAWVPYQVASGTRRPDGALTEAILRPVPNSVAVRDIARVRAQQEILAKKSATATPTKTRS